MPNRECQISDDDCTVGYRIRRGWCDTHYQRWKRNGDPTVKKQGAGKRFLEELLAAPPTDECVEWPFNKDPKGYGRCWWEGRQHGAHRVVLTLTVGPCPDGMEACHNCGNPLCVNPTHLRWDTRKNNHADKVLHGTKLTGEQKPQAKLTWEAVDIIRSSDATQQELADRFGVAQQTISGVRRYETWIEQ